VAVVGKTIENVSDRPNGIALAQGDLWITSGRQPFLTRVVAATGSERARHPKAGGEVTSIVASRGDVWIAVATTREILRLDGRTGKVRTRIGVPARPQRLAVTRDAVWVATETALVGPGQLLRYDRAGGPARQAILVNEGVGGLTSEADALWVIKDRTRKVARLDPGASVLTDWATLSAPAQSMRYDAGFLWVTLEGEDAVARIATEGGNMRTVAAGHAPSQSVIAGGHLFVANRNDNSVLVYDPDTLERIGAPIKVGFNPFAMVADDRHVWVTGLGDNSLTRLDYR
jgi:YVTN family beta-propeller protein